MEIWKDIPIKRLEKYEASTLGNIRHRKRKQNLKFSNNKGYFMMSHKTNNSQKTKSFLVHRLIAITFLGDHPELVVDHKNNIKTDNRLENLEWVTEQENKNRYFNKFHEYKTERKYLSTGRITKLYNSKIWNSAEDFYNNLISEAIKSFTSYNEILPMKD